MQSQGGYGAIARTFALSGTKTLRSLIHRGPDPYHGLDQWRELERSHDARSTFFILPPTTGPAHDSDHSYHLDDKILYDGEAQTLRSALSDLHAKGWEIGLHPTWYTFDDSDALAREKRAIEAAIGDSVVSVRQHFLHYDPRQTPRAHEAAGLRYDSTLGFNDNVGFRRGTAYPWQIRDLQKNRTTSVLELPLVVQDTALFRRKGLSVDSEMAFEYIKILAERVRDVGGVLTLLWHPSSIADDDRWSLYQRTLTHLRDRGAWFGTVREIGEYWRERRPERIIE
jgi:peptidoglycan/xylan/chitin deacetylase (PgdA/CDA1 family)